MSKDYLIKFDSDGCRQETYADGIHFFVDENGAAQDGTVKVQELLDNGFVFVSQDDYSKLLGNDDGKQYIYKDGSFVQKPEHVQTDEEKKAAQKAEITAEYNSSVTELTESLTTATLRGDTEAVASIQADFADLQTAYVEAMKEVE
jgi:hypothetical protein